MSKCTFRHSYRCSILALGWWTCVVMINLSITNDNYLSFCIFMPCSEPLMCISIVGLFPEKCESSLTTLFQFYRCRKVSLNRDFIYLRCGQVYGGLKGHCAPLYICPMWQWIHLYLYRSIFTPVWHLCVCGDILILRMFMCPLVCLYLSDVNTCIESTS